MYIICIYLLFNKDVNYSLIIKIYYNPLIRCDRTGKGTDREAFACTEITNRISEIVK